MKASPNKNREIIFKLTNFFPKIIRIAGMKEINKILIIFLLNGIIEVIL